MNNALNTIDLAQFVADERSFLGQTLKLGVEYGLLPPNAEEAIRMYLQTQTMTFGQRNRTGLAIGREEIEQGVFQATICLDIGLDDQAEGDANKAAEVLATGDFENIRKRGWELAFFRLEEMVTEAGLFPKRRESAFLQEFVTPTKRWAHTVAGTWVCSDPEDEDGPMIVDPISEYQVYEDLKIRIDLLKGIPVDALKRYGSAAGSRGPFTDLLRNLIVSLCLGLESLLPEASDVATFEERLSDGNPSELETAVVQAVSQQIASAGNQASRSRLLADVRDVVSELVAPASSMMEQNIVTRPL